MTSPLSDKERDRLIEAAEQLKIERAKETCLRAIVLLQGRESLRDRYFIINIPKAIFTPHGDFWAEANKYIGRKERFPLFWDLMMSIRYDAARVVHIIGDSEIEEIGG